MIFFLNVDPFLHLQSDTDIPAKNVRPPTKL